MIEFRMRISEEQALALHKLMSQDKQYPKQSLYAYKDEPLLKAFSELGDLGLVEYHPLDDGMFEIWITNAGIWVYEALEYLPTSN